MRKKQKYPPMIIGWREWVCLPDLSHAVVKAKIDTGARTSAIHAWNIRVERDANGERAVFDLHPNQRDNSHVLTVSAPLIGKRSVKSSTGHVRTRFVISTRLLLAGRVWPIEMTLSRRDEMGFRMLLGRSAMSGHIVVDPARSFLCGNRSQALCQNNLEPVDFPQ